MPRVEASAVVPLDQDRAFALSQTYGALRYRWDPFIREQRLLDGASVAAKGVRTWTRSRHQLRMVSQYVAFRPPEHVGMRMLEGPWFFGTFSGGWNFAPGDGGTAVTWRYNFTIRPRWLAPVAEPLGIWLLGRDIRRRLDAFAAACADPTIVAALSGDEAHDGTAGPAEERPDRPVALAGGGVSARLAHRARAAARWPWRRGQMREAVAVRLHGDAGSGGFTARRERGAGTA